jgi:hypothetical protein
MNQQFSDWKCAILVALLLMGGAAFIMFVIHPGGFEGQIGWFIALFPGAIASMPLSDWVSKSAPWAERLALWIPTISISFRWYFVISYTVIKAYRFVYGALV